MRFAVGRSLLSKDAADLTGGENQRRLISVINLICPDSEASAEKQQGNFSKSTS